MHGRPATERTDCPPLVTIPCLDTCATPPPPSHARADTEPYAKARDAAIVAVARAHGVAVQTFDTHTLHPPAAYLRACGGERGFPTGAYASFHKLFLSLGSVPPSAPAVAVVPSVGSPEGGGRAGAGAGAGCSVAAGLPGGEYDVPSLEDMGYTTPGTPSLVRRTPFPRSSSPPLTLATLAHVNVTAALYHSLPHPRPPHPIPSHPRPLHTPHPTGLPRTPPRS